MTRQLYQRLLGPTTAVVATGAAKERACDFFADLAHRREEVNRRCRTALQAHAQELIGNAQSQVPAPANVDFTLASVSVEYTPSKGRTRPAS